MSDNAHPAFCCPTCRTALEHQSDAWLCIGCGISYPETSRGIPVIFSDRNDLFRRADYLRASPEAPLRAKGMRMTGESINLSREPMLLDMRERLPGNSRVLLVGSGAQRAAIEATLGQSVIALDVDAKADVDVFADAHELPFPAEYFDAVVTTAVLEHVLSPERVVSEIVRVLRVGGLVYSEYPFMQQVHEGAYDFTRVSLSGHRVLFRDFDEISSGSVAGPGTALLWSIEHFMLSATNARTPSRRMKVKGAVRLTCSWIARIDKRIAGRPAGLDAASCTYFFGHRLAQPKVGHALDVVARYDGAQDLRHS